MISRNFRSLFKSIHDQLLASCGSFAYVSGLLAESIRTIPYLRMPISLSFCAYTQLLRTSSKKFCGHRRFPTQVLPILELPRFRSRDYAWRLCRQVFCTIRIIQINGRIKQSNVNTVKFNSVYFRLLQYTQAWSQSVMAVPNPDLFLLHLATWHCAVLGNCFVTYRYCLF